MTVTNNITDDKEKEMDRETAAVLKERVAKSTRGGYDGRNVSFMLWLFDSGEMYQELLQPGVLEKMRDGYAKDTARRNKNGSPCKKRDYIRAACIEAIDAIDPEISQTLPVHLESLSFRVFSRYLSTFKKRVKKRSLHPDENVVVETGNDKLIRLSSSSYDAACSALSHLFQESRIDKEATETTKELWTKIASYKKGTRRISAKERDELGLSQVEGKKALPFEAYKHLAKILFESKEPEHIAAHTFLLLEWNLISRAKFVVDAKIDTIWCKGDAMLFEIGITKTDQEGTKNVDHPWHCYSNLEDPYIDLWLAMARHLICNENILLGECGLFEGSHQYDRFNQIFLQTIRDPKYRDKFSALGMPAEDFGTHSIRKGAVTFIQRHISKCRERIALAIINRCAMF